MNPYIDSCITNETTVNVITINGFQMFGKIIEEHDSYIVLVCGNTKKLVYKHAISTIEPAKSRNKA